MPRSRIAALAVATLLAAGCSSGDAGDSTASLHAVGEDQAAREVAVDLDEEGEAALDADPCAPSPRARPTRRRFRVT